MNRRRTLTGLAAGAASGLAAPMAAKASPGADAELIALCARFDAVERHMMAAYAVTGLTFDEEKERLEGLKPLHAEQEALLDRITDSDMVAKTPDGIKARCRMIMLYGPTCLESPGGWDDMMIASLLDDMKGMMS